MRRYPRTFHQSLFVLLFVIVCLIPFSNVAGQTNVTGAFEGQVLNAVDNSPVVGATVQIINKDTGVPVARQTDSEGRFRRDMLPPGDYIIRVSLPGYKTYEREQSLPALRPTPVVPVPVRLEPEVAAAVATPTPTEAPTPSTAEAKALPSPSPSPKIIVTEGGLADINTTDGQRGGTFTKEEVSTLPLGAITLVRTFDELGLLLPGVATPPQTPGSIAGPGVGAGVGSSGQFSVNGMRSRANNFTVDGSDNNDEDIGVRRQGFLALVPQSIETIQEYQIITLLAPAQYGRNFGGQVNAVSKSGTSDTHGAIFGFLNASQLNARNFFDSVGRNSTTPLQANGQNVILHTQNVLSVQTRPDETIPITNASGGKESFTLAQAGVVIGGPLVPPNPAKERSTSLFYLFSVEGQLLNANKEANFAVPTVAQRGLFNSGVTGVFVDPFYPVGDPRRNVRGRAQSRTGAGIFSLFPFPNNPTGIYGANTLTRTLPASGFSKVLSAKINGTFYLGGRRQDLTTRYNFTDDARTIPVTGDGLFSSVRPRVRTQNFSSFLTSELTNTISNEVRASYGRTRLVFDEVPDREFLIPSRRLPDEPFLLNAPYIADITRPTVAGVPNSGPVTFFRNLSGDDPFRGTSEDTSGPIGQVKVAGFSPLGVDVFNFPQRRVNNTYQLADTLSLSRGNHRFAFGADIRRVELNSDLPRNARPLAVYSGQVGSDQTFSTPGGAVLFRPQDFVAAGAPTGFLQTINTTGTSAINLRYYEYNFFGQDQWRIRPNLSLSFGIRYEYNSPPHEANERIENTFNSPAINTMLPALRAYLDGRTQIYDPERMNIAPRLGIAYGRRLFGSSRETVFRAGYGTYYDQILGAVVSQSRNVFPSFLTTNFGGGEAQFAINTNTQGQTCAALFLNRNDCLSLFSPVNLGFNRFDANGNIIRFDPLVRPGTLNQLNTPNVSFAEFFNSISFFLPAGGFGVTLPTRRLKTPIAQHYSFTLEQPLGQGLVLSLAYVGTQGRHLLRVNTPNAGENLGIVLNEFFVGTDNIGFPQLFGDVFPPTAPSPTAINRPSGPDSALGAVNQIETSANSRYDAAQIQLRGRLMNRLQFQIGYTFGKATDDVSDVFDLAGASSLPQDFTNLSAERGPANFDVRHRLSHNVLYTFPGFNNHSQAVRRILGGLEIAATGQFQTGQPFTVNSIFDVNGDGNFSDRLNSTNGLVQTGNGRQPLQLTGTAAANPGSLLAPDFTDGKIGRNTFRADKLWLTTVAVVRNISLSEQFKLVFRTEVFNIFNRANFGIPVRFLEAPGFGKATDTVTPGRRIQFALKLVF